MSMGNHLLFDHSAFGLVQSKDASQEIERQVGGGEEEEEEEEGLGAMKEMMYKIAAMQPVDLDPSTIKKPRRRNVRISDHPQSVAARRRRERISERIRILQRLVPGGTKMDTASMLDEAVRYVKFLERQVRELQAPPHAEQIIAGHPASPLWADPHASSSSSSSSSMGAPPGLGFGFHGGSDCRGNITYILMN